MSWNYRVGTRIFSYAKEFENTDSNLKDIPNARLFSIIEVYYDKNGIPQGHVNASVKDWDSYEDLVGTHNLMAQAFQKPILDLDNWPNEWKE